MILTTLGQQLIATAITSNSQIVLSKIAIGDGSGSQVVVSENQTRLVGELYRGPISEYTTIAGEENTIQMIFVIPAHIGGFKIREIGVFNDNDQLIAVDSTPEIYKPDPITGQNLNVTIKCTLVVTNKVNIKLTNDPNYNLIKSEVTTITNNIFEIHNTDATAHLNIALPDGGHDGDILVKYGSSARKAVWRSPTEMIGVIKIDENNDLYII